MYREQELKQIFDGHHVLVAGYGREGRSTERLVKQLGVAAGCAVADGDREIAAEAASGRYDMIVKSPGVPMRLLPEECRPCVTSLTDIFMQVYADLTVGVTGTKGKSTTASLIHHLLSDSVLAGNIGIPLFDVIEELEPGRVVVAELSCHQLEVLHRSPHVAVMLNFYQEHLDHYDGYMGYKMAKMQIAMHQQPCDHLYYCADNAELADMVEQYRRQMLGEVHPYSLQSATDAERIMLGSLSLIGSHNRSNALVATRVATLLTGQDGDSMAERLTSFKGLRHRLEYVGRRAGIDWYDDSISTIPQATVNAVQALGGVDTLIIGGFDRGIDYAPLVDFLMNGQPAGVVFVGAAGRRVRAMCDGLRGAVCVEDDYAKIVPWCAAHTRDGGKVLLSPAAASYDAFKNFEERGDYYREQIMKL